MDSCWSQFCIDAISFGREWDVIFKKLLFEPYSAESKSAVLKQIQVNEINQFPSSSSFLPLL